MKIIICSPNIPPYLISITGKYKELQEIIGQNIKVLSLNHPTILILCDEDYYNNFTGNREKCRLGIPGTFVFVAREKNRLRSLTDEEINIIIDTIRKQDLTLVHCKIQVSGT
ncbi:DUF3846 domain-containing protein [Calidifontibacillus erzurumensis]|uniref:DUF3846 domain-containing protein n=1 Tax=Calidifontibacillus erzurumensis TaxID=2741433 RepID=A0A8J8GFJ7_9BACI|nr:hypothetical protein [Calidifontibacillus erzurumensis]NSL50896.1 hypothetical protein [Calidifontibacillus erzurumensis]